MSKENITYHNQILATIIPREEIKDGIHFYTDDSASLQVGRHYRAKGGWISPHTHTPIKVDRHEPPQEVLYIEKGKMEISFFSEQGTFIASRILKTGDLILIQKGGHGFKFLEETKMIEIKQGPFDPSSKKNLEVHKK